MHVLCIFLTNLTLGIRTKDLHSTVRSRRPVAVPIKCPSPTQNHGPAAPKLKVPELRVPMTLIYELDLDRYSEDVPTYEK